MSSCILLFFMTAGAGLSVAQDVPRCSNDPSDQEVSARLAWIERRLAAGTPYAASWWGGWLSFATAEGIWGWVKFAQTRDRLDRDTWLVTGIGSALWVPQLLIWPLRSAYAVHRVRRLPHGTPDERRNSLSQAERLLEGAADSERESTGWTEHLLDTAWTVGSTAYIFGRSYRASSTKHARSRVLKVSAVELALSELVTEAAILSTPRKAIRDLNRYHAAGCERFRSDEHLHSAQGIIPQWNVDLTGSQFALTVRF